MMTATRTTMTTYARNIRPGDRLRIDHAAMTSEVITVVRYGGHVWVTLVNMPGEQWFDAETKVLVQREGGV